VQARILELRRTRPAMLNRLRRITASAVHVDPDKQGRILIPSGLKGGGARGHGGGGGQRRPDRDLEPGDLPDTVGSVAQDDDDLTDRSPDLRPESRWTSGRRSSDDGATMTHGPSRRRRLPRAGHACTRWWRPSQPAFEGTILRRYRRGGRAQPGPARAYPELRSSPWTGIPRPSPPSAPRPFGDRVRLVQARFDGPRSAWLEEGRGALRRPPRPGHQLAPHRRHGAGLHPPRRGPPGHADGGGRGGGAHRRRHPEPAGRRTSWLSCSGAWARSPAEPGAGPRIVVARARPSALRGPPPT
jgi:hypothetical protein